MSMATLKAGIEGQVSRITNRAGARAEMATLSWKDLIDRGYLVAGSPATSYDIDFGAPAQVGNTLTAVPVGAGGTTVVTFAYASVGAHTIVVHARNASGVSQVAGSHLIQITPGAGASSGLPLLALQTGASLQLSAQALRGGFNMTLPGTGNFTWDASYAPAGTTYSRLLAGAVTTGSCPAAGTLPGRRPGRTPWRECPLTRRPAPRACAR